MGRVAMKRFIDIGANLTDPQFRGIYRGARKHVDDFDAMLGRASASHVQRMLVTGSSLAESQEAMELCAAHRRFLYSTVGVHPCCATDIPTDSMHAQSYYTALEVLAEQGRDQGIVRAFGEIGLDYDRLHYAPADIQRAVFARQLEIATRVGLPLFLHCRNAAADFYSMIQPYTAAPSGKLQGVVHSFTGSEEELRHLLALGLYIGVNGCSLKEESNLAVVKEIPLDRLMLETDGPWCEIRRTHASHKYTKELPYEYANKPKKWKAGQMVKGRCEPCSIGNVARVVAAVKGVDEQTVIDAAWDNTMRVFFSEDTV